MKKLLLFISLILTTSLPSFAHYMWIETNATGTKNQSQEIKVYFGEYTYGVSEKVKGEAFPKVKDFTLWVIDSKGNKTELAVKPATDHYTSSFTPKEDGTYTVILNNDKIDVIDYTKYDFGIFKTHYHSTAKIQVGEKAQNTVAQNDNGISIKEVKNDKNEVTLQVLYKGKPLPKNEVKVFVSDLWSKTLHTNEEGSVSFNLPWNMKYVIETTLKEELPGKYKGTDYEFIWHCATYCIPSHSINN
ncbi:DUF4198 domain-containing protein [Limibacter armeniacum]|uniref:DUF4198 domain-containing protein n=1 Tax=Limibacter armeniacum TaxID=466084 RepID=UPI002FE56890